MSAEHAPLTPRRAAALYAWHAFARQGHPLTVEAAQLVTYLHQRVGMELGLRDHQASPRGPHSAALLRVMDDMRPASLRGALELGSHRVLTLEPLAVERARHLLLERPAARAPHERLTRMMHGMETFYGLWLLSCLDWLMTRHAMTDAEALTRALCTPRQGRIQAQPRHVAVALERLRQAQAHR